MRPALVYVVGIKSDSRLSARRYTVVSDAPDKDARITGIALKRQVGDDIIKAFDVGDTRRLKIFTAERGDRDGSALSRRFPTFGSHDDRIEPVLSRGIGGDCFTALPGLFGFARILPIRCARKNRDRDQGCTAEDSAQCGCGNAFHYVLPMCRCLLRSSSCRVSGFYQEVIFRQIPPCSN